MPTFKAPLDLTGSELRNAVVQNLGVAPTTAAGRIYYDTGSTSLKYWNGTAWVSLVDPVPISLFDANTILKADTDNTPAALTVGTDTLVGRVTGVNGGVISALTATQTRTFLGSLDLFTPPAAALNLNSQRITSLGSPVSATDAATKAYVDSTAQGLDIKESVRVASSANVTIATPGASIDGVSMVAGDRVLLMGQNTGSQNGIYTWNGASAAMTRTADADSSAEVNPGMFTFVEEGATNADKGFVLTTNSPITLDTTALTFTQFSGSGTVTGTTDRITVTGNQVDIAATYVGQASITTLGTIATGTWQGSTIGVLYGGTGATTAAGARTNLGAVGTYNTTIGNASAVTFNVTHNLGTLNVVVELYDSTTKQTVYADVTRVDNNTITVAGFTTAPGNNAITVVVQG